MVALPARRTLADVVAALDAFVPTAGCPKPRTIFAERPWRPDSLAVVLDEEALRGRAPSMPSYAYLLEVDRAAEVLEVWSRRRAGAAPSPQEAAEALVHYAAHDDHQPATCQQQGCGRAEAGCCSQCRTPVCLSHADRSMPELRCSACSRKAAASETRPAAAARRFWRVLLLAGVLSLALGAGIRSVPLWVGGTCVAVLGVCVWLGGLVQRLMS